MAAKKKNYLEYTPEEHTWSDEVKNAEQDHNYWKGQQLKDFTYDDFSQSQQTTDYLNQLNGLKGPGQFQFTQQQGWQNVIDQIMNREKFSYDVNGDALYQQYKDQYVNQGKMAMMDTMGQAAAMTGGYGNSYAQSVGQQAYQGHLQQLTDKIPELYSLALDKYNSEGQDLYNKYGLYSDQYNVEYGQHRDAVGDYQADRNYLAGRYDSSLNADLDIYNTKRDTYAAEVESHNSNITANRNYYTDVYNGLKNTEWGQHMDNETLKKLAIDVANGNLAQEKADDLARDQYDEGVRQFNKKFEADTGYTVDGKKSTTFAKEPENNFTPFTYSGTDADGKSIFYRDGKEYTYERGVNPYTGTKNPDAKNGTFNNGYQPDNVNGKKLQKSGYTCEVNGVTQNVWYIKNSGRDGDVSYYAWDGTKNMYEEIPSKLITG